VIDWSPLRGLIAATFTPMNKDGTLNLKAVPAITEFVIGQGIDGLFVCGSTGEGTSLTSDERRAVTEAYVSATAGRVPVIVHVGHNSVEEATALAAHAAQAGADAIAAMPPAYFRPESVDVLIECLKPIAGAASNLPLYYYHIPALTGVHLPMVDFLAAARESLPTLSGIKFSNTQLDDLLSCVQFDGGRYNILFGTDEMLLAGLAMGAAGAVGSTYNFLAPTYRGVIEGFQARQQTDAQSHQAKATEIVRVILAHGGLNALKAAMCILGEDCGPPRLPISALSPDQFDSLGTQLRALVE